MQGIVIAGTRSGAGKTTVSTALMAVPEVPFRGGLIRAESIVIPECHLGLLTADENPFSGERMSELADRLEAGLDLDSLLNDLPVLPPPESTGSSGTGPVSAVSRQNNIFEAAHIRPCPLLTLRGDNAQAVFQIEMLFRVS